MSIRVYDYRTDIANLIVSPEIRGRFMRMDPAPAGRMLVTTWAARCFSCWKGSASSSSRTRA